MICFMKTLASLQKRQSTANSLTICFAVLFPCSKSSIDEETQRISQPPPPVVQTVSASLLVEVNFILARRLRLNSSPNSPKMICDGAFGEFNTCTIAISRHMFADLHIWFCTMHWMKNGWALRNDSQWRRRRTKTYYISCASLICCGNIVRVISPAGLDVCLWCDARDSWVFVYEPRMRWGVSANRWTNMCAERARQDAVSRRVYTHLKRLTNLVNYSVLLRHLSSAEDHSSRCFVLYTAGCAQTFACFASG